MAKTTEVSDNCFGLGSKSAAFTIERPRKRPGKSIVTKCILWPREDQKRPMFYFQPDGTCIVNLVGYAVIPAEEYERIKAKAGEKL
jgi:hypothetical protein